MIIVVLVHIIFFNRQTINKPLQNQNKEEKTPSSSGEKKENLKKDYS